MILIITFSVIAGIAIGFILRPMILSEKKILTAKAKYVIESAENIAQTDKEKLKEAIEKL